MAWPTPTSAGADLFHQYLAENQQQQYVNNTPHQPSASLTDHTPLANPQIQSESMSHTSSHLPQQPGPSASGPSSHSPVGYGHAQSPQAHQAAGGSGSTAPNRSMLETQRSLQARGKNYHFGSGGPQGREWEERQRRDEAVSILESEEMIMWIAGVRNESIPQTRAHYRNIVLGLAQWTKDDAAWRDEWEVQGTRGGSVEGQSPARGSPARSGKGKERDIAKMRKRVSSGQAHG